MGFEKSKTLISVNKDDRSRSVLRHWRCHNEVCTIDMPEEYYAYHEGRNGWVLEYAEHYGSMEAGNCGSVNELKIKNERWIY